ncbi:MAG: hypothetical protein H0V44_14770 [Planctomycetes bacterium]|nr:hypothetical protein [Planctomycetota bacterium]
MEPDAYNERINRLESALLRQGGRRIAMNAVGEIDRSALLEEMARLDYTFIGSEPQGFTYAAEFRRPGRAGGRAHHAVATAYSEHGAILEAAILALTGSGPGAERDSSNPPGASPQHVERWMPRPGRSRALGQV